MSGINLRGHGRTQAGETTALCQAPEGMLLAVCAQVGTARIVGRLDARIRRVNHIERLREDCGRAAAKLQNEGKNILDWQVAKAMTRNPITIKAERLAAEALEILRSKKIDEVPVVDKKHRPVGLLDVQDLLRAGLV